MNWSSDYGELKESGSSGNMASTNGGGLFIYKLSLLVQTGYFAQVSQPMN